jgi:hypothetical protein
VSEAVEEYDSEKWRDQEGFHLNELGFRGKEPDLLPGDLATFRYESGIPERVRTSLGESMSTVSEHDLSSIHVFITYVEKTREGLYVDGYRSTGSMTAIPVDEIQADGENIDIIRGGRMRWRPRTIRSKDLLGFAVQSSPFVFRTQSGRTEVAVSILPPETLIIPNTRTEKSPGKDEAHRQEIEPRKSQQEERGDKDNASHKKIRRVKKTKGFWGTWVRGGGR